jgi:hypothetical protein
MNGSMDAGVRLNDVYEKQDFVKVKDSNKTWVRIMSVGGLTLVATWVRDDLIEKEKGND